MSRCELKWRILTGFVGKHTSIMFSTAHIVCVHVLNHMTDYHGRYYMYVNNIGGVVEHIVFLMHVILRKKKFSTLFDS